MDLRRIFNEDERNYERIRPGYVQELYECVFRYAKVGKESRLLEIGIGTGQATAPFLEQGCQVTAVELGDRLAAVSQEKYKQYSNFQITVGDFMDLATGTEQYDLVYAATAFHWLPPEAYGKVWDSLKPGGTVALFWNRPFVRRLEDPSNVASCSVYEKYRPSDRPRTAPWSLEDCEPRRRELLAAGFSDVEVRLFHRVRSLAAEDYIALLNTYSDHRAMEPSVRRDFEADMLEELRRIGGNIRIYDTMDLYLGRKD